MKSDSLQGVNPWTKLIRHQFHTTLESERLAQAEDSVSACKLLQF